MNRALSLVIVLALLSGVCTVAYAAEKLNNIDPERNWEFTPEVKYYFASNTSYQFSDTTVSNDKPLSRLEFPLNTLFLGAELRRNFPRCSIGVQALTSVMRNTYGRFKDSDWLNPANQDQVNPSGERTVFSKASNRMERGTMIGGDVDLKVSDWLKLPPSLDVRPLIGIQWQQFSMMAHDALQHEYNPVAPDLPLPGDVIHFIQEYWQYFIGMRAAWDMGRPLKLLPLKALTEVHWSYVTADNEDHHLQREGNRYTFEKTAGWGFYVSTGLRAGLTKNLSAGASIDYLIIRTTGSHRLYNEMLDTDLTLSKGVKVWSDQVGVKLDVKYIF